MKFVTGLFNGNSTKFLAAVAGAAGSAAVSGHFDWRVFAAGMVAAVGVYLFPNKGEAPPAA